MPMTEAQQAKELAARVLREIVVQPDSTLSFIARQFLRADKENDDLRLALLFYATDRNYHLEGWQGDMNPARVMYDRGKTAKEALGIPTEEAK